MENWIRATYKGLDEEHEVRVRQCEPRSRMFIEEDGTKHDILDLDFTESKTEDFDVFKQFEYGREHFEEQNAIHTDLMNRMLASMDANAIADHNAAIDEREYWRKLRGDIFLSIHKDYSVKMDAVEETEQIFSALYYQDKEFFKDK